MTAGTPEGFDPGRLLEALDSEGVRYVVVGGVSARAYGAQRRTYDLDLVPELAERNLSRLTAVLRRLGARLRIDRVTDSESRQLPVDVARVVATQEVSLWQTDAGPLDVLHGLRDRHGQLHDYAELEDRAATQMIGSRRVRVASLDDLIASKEWAARPKDLEVVAELRELQTRRAGDS